MIKRYKNHRAHYVFLILQTEKEERKRIKYKMNISFDYLKIGHFELDIPFSVY